MPRGLRQKAHLIKRVDDWEGNEPIIKVVNPMNYRPQLWALGDDYPYVDSFIWCLSIGIYLEQINFNPEKGLAFWQLSNFCQKLET